VSDHTYKRIQIQTYVHTYIHTYHIHTGNQVCPRDQYSKDCDEGCSTGATCHYHGRCRGLGGCECYKGWKGLYCNISKDQGDHMYMYIHINTHIYAWKGSSSNPCSLETYCMFYHVFMHTVEIYTQYTCTISIMLLQLHWHTYQYAWVHMYKHACILYSPVHW